MSWGEALAAAAAGIGAAKDAGGPGAVAVIGGARLTNESAYAWAKLAKGVIGTDSVDAQLGDGLPADLVLGLPRATIDEACAAPVLRHAGRRPARGAARPVPAPAGRVAGGTPRWWRSRRPRPRSARWPRPRCAFVPATRRRWPARSPATTPRRTRPGHAPRGRRASRRSSSSAARAVLAEHPGGEGVVVVAGRPSYAESGEVAAEALRVLAAALPKATFLPALRRGNVFGALDMGLAPGHPAGPGQPRCGPGALHRRLGLGARRGRARRRPTSWPPWRARRERGERRHRRARPGAAGRRPARATSPTTPWPRRRCRPATSSSR